MTFWVIRRKSDGLTLPQRIRCRGFTSTFPSSGPPRLFASERDAKCALSWWLKGITEVVRLGYYDDYTEDFHLVPVPGRRAADMEVVKASVDVL